MTQTTFTALGLSEPLLRALETRKFEIPTPIQADTIPPLLAGKDLLGVAQTGSGKTAAFTLPILQHLAAQQIRPAPFVARAVILAPTRELALQIDETVRALSINLRLRTVVIIGGASRFKQVEAMRRGADIVIGTPGRVCDLMQTRELQLGAVTHFVLDEADRMLDLGFIKDIRRIVAALPPRRQSCLFSATMPAEVASLANSLLRDPIRVEIARTVEDAPKIEQFVHHLAQSGKQSLLLSMLQDEALSRVIVFTRTKHGAKLQLPRLHQVAHAAGRADHDVGTATHGLDLLEARRATDDHNRAQTQVDAQSADGFVDLQRQFTRRCQDQRARHERCRADLLSGQMLQDRQGKGGGLAAAGLRHAEQILARQQRRDGISLNRGWDSELACLKGTQKRLGQAEGRESSLGQDVDVLQRPSHGRKAPESSSPRAIKWERTVFGWKFPEFRTRETAR